MDEQILIFLALFVSWFYLEAEQGGGFPPVADLPTPSVSLGAAMTTSLVLGSVVTHVGRRSLEGDNRSRFLAGFSLTFLLEAYLSVAYFVLTSGHATDGIRYLVSPFLWINAGLWVVSQSEATPRNRLHRSLAAYLQGRSDS